MNDWTAGYVAEIDYTHGYYPELNPLRAKLSLLNAGLVSPEFKNACELGFGQGMSVNLHAATSSIHWSGTDFNPSQAGFANELNVITGAQANHFMMKPLRNLQSERICRSLILLDCMVFGAGFRKKIVH